MTHPHRKQVRHYEQARHLHELTFFVRQEKAVVDQRCLEKDSGGGVDKGMSRRAVPTDRFCLHAGACASASPARESAVEGQSTAGQNEAACIETDTRAVGSQRL